MLEVGNHNLTDIECKSHFSLWCVLAAPLITGNDVRHMKPAIRKILTNRELIAVDQDPLGQPGVRVRKNGETEVWAKRLADGGRAVVLFNRGAAPAEISVAWEELGFRGHQNADVRELWTGAKLGKRQGKFSAAVEPHDVCVIIVKP